jgi:hypothetical protein
MKSVFLGRWFFIECFWIFTSAIPFSITTPSDLGPCRFNQQSFVALVLRKNPIPNIFQNSSLRYFAIRASVSCTLYCNQIVWQSIAKQKSRLKETASCLWFQKLILYHLFSTPVFIRRNNLQNVCTLYQVTRIYVCRCSTGLLNSLTV